MTVEQLCLYLCFFHSYVKCWSHYKYYSIGTAGTNGYLWESKYYWTTFGYDYRNSLFEGLTIDLIQPLISYWIKPVRGPLNIDMVTVAYLPNETPVYAEIHNLNFGSQLFIVVDTKVVCLDDLHWANDSIYLLFRTQIFILFTLPCHLFQILCGL